jgi:hypothetical protein
MWHQRWRRVQHQDGWKTSVESSHSLMTKALNTTRIAFALHNVCLRVVQLNNLKKGYKRNHETAAEMAALHEK